MKKVIPSHLVFLSDLLSASVVLMGFFGLLFAVLVVSYSIRHKTGSSLVEMYQAGKKGDRFARSGAWVGMAFVFFGVLTVMLKLYVGFSIISLRQSSFVVPLFNHAQYSLGDQRALQHFAGSHPP